MKRSFAVIFISLLFVAGTAAAQEKGMEPTVDGALAQIRAEQHTGSNDRINPDKVSDKLLEQLGDAVMGRWLSDRRQHEWMDNMMGGEGSATLANMHRLIGYRYLQGGDESGYPYGGMMGGPYGGGMMGGPGPGWGMMGSRRGYGMMGPGWSGGWGWIGWIVGIVIVVGIATAVIVVVSRRRRASSGDTPLEILKKRLARGEINKEEFDKLKHDVE